MEPEPKTTVPAFFFTTPQVPWIEAWLVAACRVRSIVMSTHAMGVSPVNAKPPPNGFEVCICPLPRDTAAAFDKVAERHLALSRSI